MAGLVGEGQSIEFALYQAIHWGEGGVGFNCGDIDYDTPTGGEAKCNAVDGCAWQSQGAVPRYFVGGQEQWYLEYAYFSANNGVAPAETDLQQYDLRYPFMRGDQTLDDVDDSAVQGCLQENYTQQLAQIGKHVRALNYTLAWARHCYALRINACFKNVYTLLSTTL